MKKGPEWPLLSTCDRCLGLIPARQITQQGSILLEKRCALHGTSRVIISSDYNYSRRVNRLYVAASKSANQVFVQDCSKDCGICDGHISLISTAIIELLERCDLHCSTCVAGSSPEATTEYTVDELANSMEAVLKLRPNPSLVMLSGGEPTIHPSFFAIIEAAAKMQLPHLMIITNGRMIAQSKSFAEALSKVHNLEIYLQFDSLRESALRDIRGEDLRGVREKAIKNLAEFEIPATLVCVLKRGINDDEVGRIIEFAMSQTNVRGVTFQPIRFMGRTDGSDPEMHSLTLTDVRSSIVESGLFRSVDMAPHPLSPETICVGYWSRKRQRAVTSAVNRRLYGNLGRETDERFSPPLFVPKGMRVSGCEYDDLFRVSVVSYLDRFTFTTRAARFCTIAFATIEGRTIPLDTYYLFYQDQAPRLTQIALPPL